MVCVGNTRVGFMLDMSISCHLSSFCSRWVPNDISLDCAQQFQETYLSDLISS